MNKQGRIWPIVFVVFVFGMTVTVCPAQDTETLSPGVQPVWDLSRAYRETTPTFERVSINGLWRWQPADPQSAQVPAGDWGYFKVPGCWPGITDYLQKDSQTVHAHPSWRARKMSGVVAAWYEREITIPESWSGRRITFYA